MHFRLNVTDALLWFFSETYQLPNYNVRNDKQGDETNEPTDTSNETKIYIIIASVIGSLAAIALGVAIYLVIRNRIRKRKRSNVSDKHTSVSPVDVPNGKP